MALANQTVSIAAGWSSSEAIGDAFKRHFLRLLLIREGLRLDVYKDTKNLLTVGLGHLVQPADKLPFGSVIDFGRAMQLFEADYVRLKIPALTSRASWWPMSKRLAIGSFIWCHGNGDYEGGITQRMLEDPKTTEKAMRDYVAANWDRYSPVNQLRNKYDLDLFFTGRSVSPAGTFIYDDSLANSYYSDAAYTAAKSAAKFSNAKTGGALGLFVAAAVAVLISNR